MQAIILAGGFGTRLRSIVNDLPKPMANIQNKPFLEYLVKYLQQQGFTKIIFSVHYQYEKIQNFFGNRYQNIEIEYAIEKEPLGTGGAILNSLSLVQTEDPIFIINGDTFVQLNYSAMLKQHLKQSATLSIALCAREDCSRYGEVIVDNHRIVAFKHAGTATKGLINAGIYLLSKNIFTPYSLNKSFSFERDFLHPHIQQLKPLAFIADNYFIDIGVPEDYWRANCELPNL